MRPGLTPQPSRQWRAQRTDMTLFIGASLVALAVVLFILQPGGKGLHASLERDEFELTDTEARKRVALLALRDVEYDFLAEKLDEHDYRSLKAELTAEALAALEADEQAQSGAGADEDELEAEIAAMVAMEGFWSLQAPIQRLGTVNVHIPFSPALEPLCYPTAETIADAVRTTLE